MNNSLYGALLYDVCNIFKRKTVIDRMAKKKNRNKNEMCKPQSLINSA